MGRCCGHDPNNGLLATAAALSVAIAQGKTADELNLLAALFNILGDNLALLAISAPSDDSGRSCRCPESSNYE